LSAHLKGFNEYFYLNIYCSTKISKKSAVSKKIITFAKILKLLGQRFRLSPHHRHLFNDGAKIQLNSVLIHIKVVKIHNLE